MADITAKDVAKLREESGAGMMEAKRALVDNDGDMAAAMKQLREKGLAGVSKRASRDNSEGAVAVSVTEKGSAIVELKCETDFVAKNADFVNLVNELAHLAATNGEDSLKQKETEVAELNASLKENIALGRVVRFEPKDGTSTESYLHIQADRGVNAVLVELTGGSAQLAHDIAVHIAFAKPEYMSRDEVPAEVVKSQEQEFEAISKNEGKPEAALPKIIQGRMEGFYKSKVLMDQPYAKDEKINISKLLGDAKLSRIAQVVVGS